MYICNECLETFVEPDSYEERHPYGMTYASESFSICPYCSSSDFDEAERCAHCDEWFPQGTLEDDVCTECHGDLYGEEK